MMAVSLLGKSTKNHRVVNSKWINFMICKICLHKVVKNRLCTEWAKPMRDGKHVVPSAVLGIPQALPKR